MRPARFLVLWMLLVAACLGTAVAQTSIYTVTVPVADTSAAVRDQAFATGLTRCWHAPPMAPIRAASLAMPMR